MLNEQPDELKPRDEWSDPRLTPPTPSVFDGLNHDVINEQSPFVKPVETAEPIPELEATRRLETKDFENVGRSVTVKVTEPSIDPLVQKSLDEIAERAMSGARKDTPVDPAKPIDEEVGHKAFVDTYIKPIELINGDEVALPLPAASLPAKPGSGLVGKSAIGTNLPFESVFGALRTDPVTGLFDDRLLDEPTPTPLNIELIRRQAAELEKLWVALDAANHRINALESRISNYNLRASHKI